MNRKTKSAIGLSALALALAIWGSLRFMSDEADVIVPLDAKPTELVKFTATKAYANLPLDQQLKYLHAWGQLSEQQRASAIALLIGDQRMLQLSTMQSSETLRLAQAREYFAIKEKAARRAYLDAQIDAEQEMIRKAQEMVKSAEAQSGQKVAKGASPGDPLVRKFILENAVPANRLEVNAFVNEMIERRRERGLPT